MLEVPQSLPICIALSAVGGALQVLATAILAYQDDQKKEGRVWKRSRRIAALSANVILQFVAATIGNLMATWFGPVSIVGPMFLSAQLVANMIVFGRVLGLEFFTKEMKVGTYVIVVSAVLLPTVGPQVQDGQDVVTLEAHWYSLLWSCFLLAGMFASSAILLFLDVMKLTEGKRIGLLLVARFTSFAVNLTASRAILLNADSVALLVSAIILKMVSGAVMTHAIVVQSTAVLQAKFVPLNASANILVNAITGLIIWEDWRAIGSWSGYLCVFVLLFLGNFLLLGEIELFSSESPHYGAPGTLRQVRRLRRRLSSTTGMFNEAPAETTAQEEKGGGDIQNVEDGQEGMDAGSASSDESFHSIISTNDFDEEMPRRIQHRNNEAHAADPKEAWMSVYGLNDVIHQGGGKYREHNVFVIDGITARSSSL